jgi:PmbA protein
MGKNNDLLTAAREAMALAQKKGAQQAAATVIRSRGVEVRWRDGKREAINESTTRAVNLDLFVDGRFATASTSDFRPDALATFVDDALAMARVLTADEHRALPDPSLYAGQEKMDLGLEDPKQAQLTPEQRLAFAREAEEAARSMDKGGLFLSVSTAFSDDLTEVVRVASNGFEGSRRQTMFSVSTEVSVKDADGRRPEDWAYGSRRRLADLDKAAAVGQDAARRALGRLGSKKADSGVLAMVVEARSAGRLAGMMMAPLSGAAIQQKRSFLDGKIGKKIGSDLFAVTDDPTIPGAARSRAFDEEGIARHKMPIVEKGILRTFYLDTYYARKLGVAPTTGSATNLSWVSGAKGRDELIAGIKDGILVTGFLGGNSNNATGDYSLGVVGNRIRAGKVAEPVSEMNIAGNQLELWNRLVAVGNDPFESSSTRTPTLVFDAIQFAGS